MMSAKMATAGLVKKKIFWKKYYGVIISVHDIISKNLSRESNDSVNVVMWSKFGNSSISVREVFITSILQQFDQKNRFFDGWSWFKSNNLGLALGRNLKFYISLAKGLKVNAETNNLQNSFAIIKSQNFWCSQKIIAEISL